MKMINQIEDPSLILNRDSYSLLFASCLNSYRRHFKLSKLEAANQFKEKKLDKQVEEYYANRNNHNGGNGF